MRRLISFVLGALTSAVLLVLLVAWRGSTSGDARHVPSARAKERFQSKSSAARDIEPARQVAPSGRAHVLLGWTPTLQEQAMEELSEKAINAYEELQKGDSRWQATVLRLSDLAYLRDERLQCAALHALPLRSECRGAIDMVLEPAAGGEAKVVYARATTSANEPADAASCAAYVDCLAETRVGSEIPIPPGSDELVAVRQDTIYDWTSPAMFDATKVAELIELREEALADGVAQGTLKEFERLSEEQVISYLHRHLAELREAEGKPSM